jgi:soluble lytic murein transglycosylase
VGAALAAAKRLELHQGSLPKDPHYAPAVELLRLGMLPEAARELAAVDRSVLRAAGQAGQEPLLVLADLASRAGELRAAHALIRSDLRELLRRTSRPIAVKAAVLAYPLAFRDEIAKAARGAGVPPDLLQALMREESALDPHALSPVGALGLTQLMPATARGVAKKLQLKGFKTSQLLEPATNILIGGTYLGELYARFGHPAPTLASYNAGPGNVGGWMRARPALPMDEWVEEIPLDETRGYVKRCLRSYAAYQLLYGDGVGRLLTVPQELAQK